MEVNSMTSGTQTYTFKRSGNPGCLLQILWFVFIGWWLGLIALVVAWILNITIIGLPLGLAILNNLPLLIALQTPTSQVVVTSGDRTTVLSSGLPQYNFFLRALYFLVIGWWWSFIWLLVAYIFCATIILLPLGLLMYRQVPFMTTLKRY
jgi:uncharacterized membrane protein YccF (DUF307 family)